MVKPPKVLIRYGVPAEFPEPQKALGWAGKFPALFHPLPLGSCGENGTGTFASNWSVAYKSPASVSCGI